ncbi:hypothetical protein SNEBB_007420 [Seison nebaliae]|nr:hypothetical protein SNEBB_007420 [Seison nebaliae]
MKILLLLCITVYLASAQIDNISGQDLDNIKVDKDVRVAQAADAPMADSTVTSSKHGSRNETWIQRIARRIEEEKRKPRHESKIGYRINFCEIYFMVVWLIFIFVNILNLVGALVIYCINKNDTMEKASS